ncbi:MAG: hypothetical protein U0670_01725 [Anaerolineae bacterium]
MTVLLVLLSAAGVFAQSDTQAEGGDYWVTGTDAAGTEYSAGLEILASSIPGVLTLSWEFDNPLYGYGIINGNVVSSAWGGPGCAVGTYQMADNGDLSGAYYTVGSAGLGTETAVFQGGTDTSAAYILSGQTTDGVTYTGTMAFSFTGMTGQVAQEINGQTVTGTSIRQGAVVTVVFGGDGCGLTAFEIGENSSLSGYWTTFGSDTAYAQEALPINIAGTHNVTGTNPDGTEYTGTLEVSADNQVHTFVWNLNGTQIPGVGIMRGNHVAVGFGGETCSVGSYFLYPNGTLSGQWTIVGRNTVGGEVAIPNFEPTFADGAALPDIAGNYNITGSNPTDPNAAAYQGTLDIIPQGEVYQLVWTFADGSTADGIGILVGNTLIVGYGGETCAVNSYRVLPDQMVGVWGVYGRNELGTETATR